MQIREVALGCGFRLFLHVRLAQIHADQIIMGAAVLPLQRPLPQPGEHRLGREQVPLILHVAVLRLQMGAALAER